jgi:hypothetical protein
MPVLWKESTRMPLHEWTDRGGWEGLHDIWIVELLRHIKPRLPAGYRAYIGSTPALTIGAPDERPDVSVRQWTPDPPPPELPSSVSSNLPEPDEEVASLTLDPQSALYVAAHGRMVAAVELVSPRNKDRPSSREYYLSRYLGYLHEGAHLLLVDVHRRPLQFSFADALATELQTPRPPCPSPFAVAYRVGEPAPKGGRLVGFWQQPLTVGAALPAMPLPLTVASKIDVDLEATYQRAAQDVYLE